MSNNKHDENMYSQSRKQNFSSFKQVMNTIAYEKDVEYMKQLYPAALKHIQAEIDEQCDKLEYAGSVMFDEYPDKNHLRMIVDTILQKLKSEPDEPSFTLEKASLDSDVPQYCSDDAMLDCLEVENGADEKQQDSVSSCELVAEKTASENTLDAAEAKEDVACIGPFCGGPGPWTPWPYWPPRPPRPRPPHPPGPRPPYPPGPRPPYPPGPRPPRPKPRPWSNCGPYCPYANQPCGNGKYCPPIPYPDLKEDGSPDWLRHLVENMLSNEMNYRRNRFRSKNI